MIKASTARSIWKKVTIKQIHVMVQITCLLLALLGKKECKIKVFVKSSEVYINLWVDYFSKHKLVTECNLAIYCKLFSVGHLIPQLT